MLARGIPVHADSIDRPDRQEHAAVENAVQWQLLLREKEIIIIGARFCRFAAGPAI